MNAHRLLLLLGAVGAAIIAWDHTAVGMLPPHGWTIVYGTIAALAAWCAWKPTRPLWSAAIGLLVVGTVLRAVALTAEHRWSGAGLQVVIVALAFGHYLDRMRHL